MSQESLVNTGLCTFKLIFHFWFNRQKKKNNNKINPPYLHEKAQDLNLKKKILDPYPPSCSPSWHLCYDSEALTEERGVGSKDITQWYDHLPWPPPTNVPLWVRPPCSHMTMMIITSVQKKTPSTACIADDGLSFIKQAHHC